MLARSRLLGQSGVEVSELGFGAAPVGNLYRRMSDETAGELLAEAWGDGIRYFDTAPLYGFGLSEERIGKFLRRVPAGEAVISTKAGRRLRPNAAWHAERENFIDAAPYEPWFDYSYDGVMRSFEDSLVRLGVDRVDILFMHDIGVATHGEEAHPSLMKTAMEGGYRALDELRRDGRVKAIGLGVNEWQVCAEAMDHGDWDCFLLAGRYTLLEQEPVEHFLPRCEKDGIGIIIGAPFNSGILATGPREGARYNYGRAPEETLRRVASLDDLCRAHGVPLAAAALQFPLAHPAVASVIPGMASVADLQSCLALAAHVIPGAFWADLAARGLIHPRAPVPAGPAA
ncbi:MAG: aldo/keto reductase [Parvibaculum sp.]|uniref:aldo/keto reductase n=1 Tax=Parvibaculum sp. TaxID=2024848 RepID=UPI003C7429F6